MDNNIFMLKKLYNEKEQYKTIAEEQSKLLKESTELLQKLKAENKTLKSHIELALSIIKELTAEIDKRHEIDFPNSMKGGIGETGTPSIFPEDSNLF